MKRHAWICCFAVMLLLLPFAARAELTGTCGENAQWRIDDDRVLTISGTGEIRELDLYAQFIGQPLFEDMEIEVDRVIIEDGITAIGDSVFSDCLFAASVTIPDSVVEIGGNPFFGCYWLENIIVSPDHPVFETIDGVLFSKADQRLVAYPAGLAAETYRIPDGTRSIGDHAFAGCDLRSVTIPDSAAGIGEDPFLACACLESIIVSPDHPALEMKDGVLFSKQDQKLITYTAAFTAEAYRIPDGTRSIGEHAFYGCAKLRSVIIPDSVAVIGDHAFRECVHLTSVTIPDSVVSIGDHAFRDCRALTSVTIPDSVVEIGIYAFMGCGSLEKITAAPGNPAFETINGVLFSKADQRLIVCPAGYTEETYRIPDGTRLIADHAFDQCYGLRSVTIPDSVAVIGDHAFYKCYGLTSVTIPDSVVSIGDEAFSGANGGANGDGSY